MTQDISYSSYLSLQTLLDTQHPVSEAHDEIMFITVHQVYEMWFKLVLFELNSVQEVLAAEVVRDEDMRTVGARLNRILTIVRHVGGALDIMETMTPLDFLDFRHVFRTASGFQSLQFRELEVKLGLSPEERIGYAGKSYETYLAQADQQHLAQVAAQPTLLDQVNAWLARTPFVEFGDFKFWDSYRQAVSDMVRTDREAIFSDQRMSQEARTFELAKLESMEESFQRLFSSEHQDSWRLSNKALQAALFIFLYRDEPALQLPHAILNGLMDLDETLALWRYRHALMAQRMLGSKMGSGGSSGHDYLVVTATKHRVFRDLFALSTFLIPRSKLPELPPNVKETMSFGYWRDAALT